MSTCTDLINAINAVVVNPNFVASVDPSTIAVLSGIGTTETVFQLGVGGPAILSTPSTPVIDGQLVRLVTCGVVASGNTPSTSVDIKIYIGNGTLGIGGQLFDLGGGAGGFAQRPFVISSEFMWSSVTESLGGYANSFGINGSASMSSISTAASYAAQTDLTFFVSGQFNHSDATNEITLTQFALELV